MSQRLKAVLFDFGGVLAEEGFREGLKAIAEKNRLDPEEFFAAADNLIYESGYLTGMASESEYWKMLRERTGIRGADREFRNEILERFIPRPRVMRYTDTLREGGYTVALLSDQTNWLDEIDARIKLFRHFDRVFNSYVYHKSKRDPSIYRQVCGDLSIKPGQALFIDDNIGHIRRAEEAGLHAIHFTDFESFKTRIDACIASGRPESRSPV